VGDAPALLRALTRKARAAPSGLRRPRSGHPAGRRVSGIP
jgi:hypothetical protein